MALWMAAAAGCDRASPPITGGLPVHVTWTSPSREAIDVPLLEPIRIQFDRFLAPYAGVRQSVCIESATYGGARTDLKQCLTAFEPSYDPVDRVVVFRPTTPMLPNTRYNVIVQAPEHYDSHSGVHAFDGAHLEDDYAFAFWTGDGTKAPTQIRRKAAFCKSAQVGNREDVSPLGILRHCSAGSTCHGPGPMQGVPPHGGVLRLRHADYVDDDVTEGIAPALAFLIERSQVATETATAPDPATAQRSVNSVFGQNMPYIDTSNSANSYLLYKLIIGLAEADRVSEAPTTSRASSDASARDGDIDEDAVRHFGAEDAADGDGAQDTPVDAEDASQDAPAPHGDTTVDVSVHEGVEPWVPDAAWQPAAPGEYDRLRDIIRGEPMPYAGHASWWWAETMGAWIAGGAKLAPCNGANR